MELKKQQLLDRTVGLIIMIFLLIPQYWSTQAVFNANDKSGLIWIAWSYAIGIDTAVLYFTYKGWIKIAFLYLLVSVAHNISYHLFPQSISAVFLISICSPATIFTVGHLFLHRKLEEVENLKGEKIDRLYKSIEAGVIYEAQPYQCPECNASFSGKIKLNGHITSHKKNNEWKLENYGDWEQENRRRAELVNY